MPANVMIHVFNRTFILFMALNFITFNSLVYAATDNFAGYTMEMNGSASVVSGDLQLTPAFNSQAGSAFVTTPFPVNGSTSFSTYFQFVINGGTNGADGFTFILQNDPAGIDALGGAGGLLGYAGISNSLAIEFDTYENSPDNNHIGIDTNGSVSSLETSTSVPDINSGSSLFAWIDYDGTTNLLRIFVNDTSTKPAAPNLSGTVDLPSLTLGQAYIGFSAATGGLNNEHLIEDWTLDVYQPYTSIPTLNEWGLIILSILMIVITFIVMRKQQKV